MKKRKTALQHHEALTVVRESTSAVMRLRDLPLTPADEKLIAMARISKEVNDRAEGTTRALLTAGEVLPELVAGLNQVHAALTKLRGAEGLSAFTFGDTPMKLNLDDAMKDVGELLAAAERVRIFVGENAPDVVTAVGSVST